jgi:hypothetical protein
MIRLFGLHNFQLIEGVKHLVEVLFLTSDTTKRVRLLQIEPHCYLIEN